MLYLTVSNKRREYKNEITICTVCCAHYSCQLIFHILHANNLSKNKFTIFYLFKFEIYYHFLIYLKYLKNTSFENLRIKKFIIVFFLFFNHLEYFKKSF